MKNLTVIFISPIVLIILNTFERKFFRMKGFDKDYSNFSLLIFIISCLIIFYTIKILFKNYNYKLTFGKLFLFGLLVIITEYFLNFIVQNIDFYIFKNEITNENLKNVPDYMQNFIRRPQFSPLKVLVFDPIQILIWKIFENRDVIGFFKWILANRITLLLTLTFIVYKIYKKK